MSSKHHNETALSAYYNFQYLPFVATRGTAAPASAASGSGGAAGAGAAAAAATAATAAATAAAAAAAATPTPIHWQCFLLALSSRRTRL